MIKKAAVMCTALALGTPTFAADQFTDNLYFGGGVSNNDLSGFDNAIGFQGFAGYDFNYRIADKVTTAAEVGYMDSGDFDRTVNIRGLGVNRTVSDSASGLWATGVVGFPINKKVTILARAGLDFGDDDGPIIGGGVELNLSRNWGVRFEYVMRDNIDSIQANFAYYPR